MRSTVFYLLAIIGATYGLPWDGVQPTKQSQYYLATQIPLQPTAAPKPLHRRQQPGDFTCGYYQNSSADAIYCVSSAVCATNSFGAAGCCRTTGLGLDNCALATTCIDSTAMSHYAPYFLDDWLVTSCTDATAPLCITQTFEYDYVATAWDCGSSGDLLHETYYTTYANATTTQSTLSIFNAYWSPTFTTPSSPTTPIIIPTPTPSPTPKSPTPIGAIVGGVIGGLALICALGVLAFLLIRKSKSKGGNNSQPQPAEMMSTNNNNYDPKFPATQTIYPQGVQSGYGNQGNSYGQAHAVPSAHPVNEAAFASSNPYAGKNAAQLDSHAVATGSDPDHMSVIAPPYSPPTSPTGFPTSPVGVHEVAHEPLHELH